MKTVSNPIHFAFALCAFVCFAFSPMARAVSPAPDGGYPNATTAEGTDALLSLTTGVGNTAIGTTALQSNTTGNQNTASGDQALLSNTTGSYNTANGSGALLNNTTGINNTANGSGALSSNTTGNQNTANGVLALGTNTGANDNTASGFFALELNTTGTSNTANGSGALQNNTTGNFNTANGQGALFNNTIGNLNTGNGSGALYTNTTGNDNTAIGLNTLNNNTTGNDNTAIGLNALNNNTTGSNNIALGSSAGTNLTTGSNNIDIGNTGQGESNTIRIGAKETQRQTFIAGIFGATIPTGIPVLIDNHAHLGTTTSSARFKQNIQPMNKASEAILALKPVTFRYKHDLDPKGSPQFGLVAEEVEKVNPDLVVRDEEGKPYSVRYDAVNAMLLNEFLKEHRKVQELETNALRQQKQIEALTAGLQKVSVQLEVSKTAPQTVLNDQ